MNHLNAVAGTSSAQTGVVSVSLRPWNWNPDGTMRIEPIHVSWFRDEQGRPVDTLFNAWKRKWPNSKTIRSLTLPIVMAVRGPGVAAGKVISDPAYARNHRISDLAVTIARMYDLTLRTTIVGQDRTADLV